MREVELVIIEAAVVIGAALALAGAGIFLQKSAARLEAAAAQLAALVTDNHTVSEPSLAPTPGPVTADNLEPEDEAVKRRRSRRGYFA